MRARCRHRQTPPSPPILSPPSEGRTLRLSIRALPRLTVIEETISPHADFCLFLLPSHLFPSHLFSSHGHIIQDFFTLPPSHPALTGNRTRVLIAKSTNDSNDLSRRAHDDEDARQRLLFALTDAARKTLGHTASCHSMSQDSWYSSLKVATCLMLSSNHSHRIDR